MCRKLEIKILVIDIHSASGNYDETNRLIMLSYVYVFCSSFTILTWPITIPVCMRHRHFQHTLVVGQKIFVTIKSKNADSSHDSFLFGRSQWPFIFQVPHGQMLDCPAPNSSDKRFSATFAITPSPEA